MRPLDKTPKGCTCTDIKHQCNLAYFYQHKVETVVLKSVNCGGTFLYRRANGVLDATQQWYYCCDLKWCFKCDIRSLLFQYLRSYFQFSHHFQFLCFCCFNTYTDIFHFTISLHMIFCKL